MKTNTQKLLDYVGLQECDAERLKLWLENRIANGGDLASGPGLSKVERIYLVARLSKLVSPNQMTRTERTIARAIRMAMRLTERLAES
ncbi:MAG: hypothetical protein JO170_09400 [Verrucomicrobia bacterium]|nr:hypothetical protein [Verrucomicrobiota bacterium]